MEVMNNVETLYADLVRSDVEGRSPEYIKDRIAVAMRAAIIEASNDFRDNDPKLADRRLECLKLATEQISNYASKSFFNDVDYTGKILGTADRLLRYVQTGDGGVENDLLYMDDEFADRETIGDVSQETSKPE